MLFNSSLEFLAVIIFLIAQLVLRKFSRKKVVSTELLLLANVLLLSTLISPLTIVIHLFISVLVFLTAKAINSYNSKGKSIVTIGVLILIVLFILRNYPKPFGFDDFNLTDSPNTFISRLGISYILFRHIRYLVNVYKQKVEAGKILQYLSFVLFFPNFLAGPIDTFKNFKHWRENNSDLQLKSLIMPGFGRITLGFIKKYILVPLIYVYAIDYMNIDFVESDKLSILVSLSFYSIYIYLDFSGYSDIAIGSGYLLGIKTAENFDNPYFSKNIADFWRRWHITFSDFLRDLLFIPIVKGINRLNLKIPRLGVSGIGYILTFAICGIWHGDTVNFLYWGVWHGFGLFAFKIWTSTKIYASLKIKISNNYRHLYDFTSMAITFGFVTVGWLFFNYQGSALTTLVKTLIR